MRMTTSTLSAGPFVRVVVLVQLTSVEHAADQLVRLLTADQCMMRLLHCLTAVSQHRLLCNSTS
jgi:hypothetical protein